MGDVVQFPVLSNLSVALCLLTLENIWRSFSRRSVFKIATRRGQRKTIHAVDHERRSLRIAQRADGHRKTPRVQLPDASLASPVLIHVSTLTRLLHM